MMSSMSSDVAMALFALTIYLDVTRVYRCGKFHVKCAGKRGRHRDPAGHQGVVAGGAFAEAEAVGLDGADLQADGLTVLVADLEGRLVAAVHLQRFWLLKEVVVATRSISAFRAWTSASRDERSPEFIVPLAD